jgi:hypothetical protein
MAETGLHWQRRFWSAPNVLYGTPGGPVVQMSAFKRFTEALEAPQGTALSPIKRHSALQGLL